MRPRKFQTWKAASRVGKAALNYGAQYAGKQIGQYLGNKYLSGTSGTRSKKYVQSGFGVTEQHDARMVYKKKRMPRRRKRVWKRFVRKVNFVAEKELGTQTVIFNKNIAGQDNNGNQIVLDFCLYGLASTETEKSDLFRVVSLDNTGNPTAAAGEVVGLTTKYMFHSGVLDMTIRNSSFTSSGATTTLASEGVMEIDVYELMSSKYWSNYAGALPSPFTGITNAFSDASTNTKTIGGAGTTIGLTQRGATPFDIPHALSTYGIRILKKTKYKISPGATFTYQMRDPGRHVMSREFVTDATSPNKPGLTRWIMLIGKGVPGVTYGSTDGTIRSKIDVGITRKYMYKIEGTNETRSRFLAST